MRQASFLPGLLASRFARSQSGDRTMAMGGKKAMSVAPGLSARDFFVPPSLPSLTWSHLTMNFDLSEDQRMMSETFARFLNEQSSMERVRKAMPSGFDSELWSGLGELGAFSLRVPEEAGGLGLGVMDAAVLMEEVGRTLASGPVAEALVAIRVLSLLGG